MTMPSLSLKFQYQFQLKMALQHSDRPICAPARLLAFSPRLPSKRCPCLSEHRSFPTSGGRMSAASFFHFSFLQVIIAVMLWPVHSQKVSQASGHLCPAKVQTSCDICCAFQFICPFIATDSGVPRAVDSQKSLLPKTVHGCVAVGAAYFRLFVIGGSLSV